MLCERCGLEKATVTTTSIVNDQVSKRSLCEACHEAEGLSLPLTEGSIAEVESLGEISKIDLGPFKLVLGARSKPRIPDRVCPECGMTLSEFRKRRVVGCPHDYEVFRDEMRELLARLHAGPRHEGKVPQAVEMQRMRDHRVRQLRQELSTAIGSERYEEAARLRDRIQALEEAPEDGDR